MKLTKEQKEDEELLHIYTDYYKGNQLVSIIFRDQKAIAIIEGDPDSVFSRIKEIIDKLESDE